MEKTIREKHPRAVRWLHWLNFPLLAVMVWSGLLIYWAYPAYIPLPDSVAEALKLDRRLAIGIGWHFAVAWLFVVNGVVYVVYLAWSGEWREILPLRAPGKLGRAQRFAYTGVLALSFLAVATGLAIWKPVQLGWLTALVGGYEIARGLHFASMLLIVLFFLAHVIQVARAGWNVTRAMISGFEVVEDGTDEKSR